MNKERSPKHQDAYDSLPPELRPIFDQLVEDYKFSCFKVYGKKFVAHPVLADLVRVGWRHSADPLPDSDTRQPE